MRRFAALMVGLLLLGGFLLVGAAAARAGEQVIRVETVGAVPAGALAPPGIPIRQAALEAALTEAVARVARDLVSAGPPPKGGATTPEPTDPNDWLSLLGGSADDYTLGYRVLEDRGERPALLVHDPNAKTEYEVLAEVHVDADRVSKRLRAVGLLAPLPAGGDSHMLTLVLEPLPSWHAITAVRQALEANDGVEAIPSRFSAAGVALRVEAPGNPGTLVDRLVASPPPGITLSPDGASPGQRQLHLVEAPAAPAPPGAPPAASPAPGAD